MSEGNSSNLSWVLPAVLGILVIGLVAIALTRGPQELEPDTPEGTVQEYLVALDRGRYEEALGVLHPQWADVCSADDIRDMGPRNFTARLGHNSTSGGFTDFPVVEEDFGPEGRIDLPGATEFVDVTITHDSGGGFGSGWDEFVVFELVDEDGFFWIVGNPWPYFTWNCRGDL